MSNPYYQEINYIKVKYIFKSNDVIPYDCVVKLTYSNHISSTKYDIGGCVLKKHTVHFLIIALLLGYLSFGILVLSNTSFGQVFTNPLHLLLLFFGFLSPFISSIIVYVLHKSDLGGLPGFLSNFSIRFSNKHFVLLILLFASHYVFGIIFNAVGAYGKVIDFFKYLPIILIIMGSQEIGWRKITQPYFEKEKGFYKSVIITGLFWAIWFLPLVFIKGFLVRPEFYTQFAIYLVGLSFLLTSIFKITKQVSYSMILSSLIISLTPVIMFKQDNIILVIPILEILVASLIKNKEFA